MRNAGELQDRTTTARQIPAARYPEAYDIRRVSVHLGFGGNQELAPAFTAISVGSGCLLGERQVADLVGKFFQTKAFQSKFVIFHHEAKGSLSIKD